MERSLSSKDLLELDKDYHKSVRFLRACARRGKMHKVEERKKDRRVAISTCIDPKMDRRSGYDRRRDG